MPHDLKVEFREDDKYSFLWWLQKIIGKPRDSTGRHNNTFFLFVLSFTMISLVCLGSVFYRSATYNLILTCPPSTQQIRGQSTTRESKQVTLKTQSSQSSQKKLIVSCKGNTINLSLTLQPPAPLPNAFYYVAFGVFLFLGVMYSIIRHKETQQWFVDMAYAIKGLPSPNASAGFASGMKPPPDGADPH